MNIHIGIYNKFSSSNVVNNTHTECSARVQRSQKYKFFLAIFFVFMQNTTLQGIIALQNVLFVNLLSLDAYLKSTPTFQQRML